MIQNKVPQQWRVFKEGLVLDNYDLFPGREKELSGSFTP
jgi:hypothetical protein